MVIKLKKTFSIVAIIAILIQYLSAQTPIQNPFKVYEANIPLDGFGYVGDYNSGFFQMPNGNFLALNEGLEEFSLYDETLTFQKATGKRYPNLKIKDKRGITLIEKTLYNEEDKQPFYSLLSIDSSQNSTDIWVLFYLYPLTNFDSHSVRLIKLNSTLNIQFESTFELFSNDQAISPITFKKSRYNDNLLIYAWKETPTPSQPNSVMTVFCEIKPSGEIITIKERPDIIGSDLERCEIIELDSNTLAIYPNFILDRNFNTIEKYEGNTTEACGQFVQVSDSSFILGGTRTRIYNLDSIWIYERVFHKTVHGALDTILDVKYQRFPYGSGDHSGHKSLAFLDTNYIYFATNRNRGALGSPDEVVLHCFALDGTHHWSKSFGNDADYKVAVVLATHDKGCIVLANRFYRDDTSGKITSDIVHAKFDKEGNVEAVLPISKVKPPDFELQLYPNPSQQSIQLKTEKDLGSFSFQAFNQEGKIILNLNNVQQSEVIDIRELHSGQYFYLVSSASKDLFFSGNFVKM